MITGNLFGVLSALTSALVWGSADYCGGIATRKGSQFQILALSTLSGVVLLIACAILLGERFPSPAGILWGMAAGLCGSVGLASLYRALSLGYMATVAPASAIIGAALPVCFSIVAEGLPTQVQVLGFTLAFMGIWLVTRPSSTGERITRQGILLSVLAGAGFGGFFIFIAQVDQELVFTPLIVSRSTALCIALLLLFIRRTPFPSPASHLIGVLAGILDAGGNIFFLLATHYTRLDVAVVLSAFYPLPTVFLAYLLLKEKVSRPQWIGTALCVTAIAFISI